MTSLSIQQITNQVANGINKYILSPATIIQLVIISSLLVSALVAKQTFYHKLKSYLKNIISKLNWQLADKIKSLLTTLVFPLLYAGFLWGYIFLAANFSWPYTLVSIIAQILTAWLIIKLISSFFHNTFMVRLFSFFILATATLNILNIYNRTITILNNIALTTGKIRISLLLIIQGFFLLSIFMWLAAHITSFAEEKIKNNQQLTPSLQVLINKFLRFSIFGLAGLISLNSLGIDLTAFTVLGGGIGLGIGFGLQKIVANFISGVIILLDKSIKPGDVVKIDNTHGLISSLNSRFVSIVTLDGEEYLIPNEDFITKKVVNLSYSDKLVRLEVIVGISYNSNVEKAIELIEEAAKETDRITNLQQPSCLLTGFGDSSVQLKLKFWITDPENGLENIKGKVLLSIWQTFQEHDIEIPYPQHDLHLQSIASEINDKNLNNKGTTLKQN